MPFGVNDYDTAELQGRNVANSNSINIISPGFVTSGMVLHLDAGNSVSYPTSGTTWYDLGERRENGTITGSGSSFVFDAGGAIDLNASPVSSVRLPTSVGNFSPQDFSFFIWFYLTSTTTSSAGQGPVIIYKGAFQSSWYYAQISQTSPASISFFTNQSGSVQVTSSTNTLTVGAWNCVAITRSGASVRIYVNGVDAVASAGSHINPAGGTTNFVINAYDTQIYGNVTYSMLSIYERMLTPAEVGQNFNATRARFGI